MTSADSFSCVASAIISSASSSTVGSDVAIVFVRSVSISVLSLSRSVTTLPAAAWYVSSALTAALSSDRSASVVPVSFASRLMSFFMSVSLGSSGSSPTRV